MPSTTDVLLLALAVLAAITIAARSYMAWQSLSESATRARQRAIRLEEGSSGFERWVADLRVRSVTVNGQLEESRLRLAALDAALEARTAELAARRVVFDEIRTQGVPRIRQMVSRLKATARVVQMALQLRRTLGA